MKTYRELYIYLNGISIKEFSERLTSQCKSPWQRRQDKEDNLNLSKEKLLCFESVDDNSILSAGLFIFPKGKDTWWISNIVPTRLNELNYDQYNRILEHFFENIVQPAIIGTSVEAKLTDNEINVSNVAGLEVENALIRFSSLANKSTGSSHPCDRDRWFQFILLAYKSKSNLNTDLVIRALVELGWSEERSIELGLQFEFAIDLLAYIQEH